MTNPESLSFCSQPEQPSNDPTERRNLREYFDLLIASMVDYAFITYDLDNCITGWNVGAERILGYCESEILGRRGSVFFTPEDVRDGAAERELHVARTTGRAENERWHVRKDGTRFWGSGLMMLLRNESGEPRAFAKVMRDLTERKLAEQALQDSEERFRLFVENVRDHALFHVSPTAEVASWNAGAESLFGYVEREIVGKPVATLFPPEDRARDYPRQELDRALIERGFEDERWMVRKDGTRFFARWVTHPMFDDSGQLRGFAKVLRDETRRIRAEEERRRREQRERARLRTEVENTGAELDRTKEELRALAASLMTAQEEERRRIARELHDDLSQRLALLEVGLAHLAERADLRQIEIADFERLQQQVATLSDSVRSLSHRLHPAMLEDLGLELALRALIQEFERVHGMTVTFASSAPARDLPLAAATALYRITQEALRNAAKHAHGSRVTVRLSQEEGALRLSIEDDGPGFNPGTARTRGLGLVSMHERARLAGGTIALRASPGAGTYITVTVPWPEDL